jgi:hypothetical protein
LALKKKRHEALVERLAREAFSGKGKFFGTSEFSSPGSRESPEH